MHFTHLRLRGFKSFVEPTELTIPPGMTGIVGPNGCGKSNLVEALRWVMGENSARRMRGSDMDDVIFGGTATRPSRNLAEVVLGLDNSDRSAVVEFNHHETLEVTRSIERGAGSDYRINGKAVRQRDVQLLFADQATGAHSTNLVGQGQIDALIRAKPQDRRQILEEASGTAGLHARRHEAELKLKAAEQNLTRVDDVLTAYDSQLRSLKQQIKQSSRYRNLAEHIRRTEAALLHLRWQEGERNAEATRDALVTAEQHVHDLLILVTQGNTARTEIAAELPALRQVETTAAAIVQKLTIAREHLAAETRRIAEDLRAHEQRLAQAKGDQIREQSRRADGENAIIALQDEQKQLGVTLADIAAKVPATTRALVGASEEVENLDIALNQLMQAVAVAEARKTSLQKDIDTLTRQQASLIQRREHLDAQRLSLANEAASRPDLNFAAALVEASETELAKRQTQAQTAEHTYREAEQLQAQARDIVRDAQARTTTLKAEADALGALLQPQDHQAGQVLDLIAVAPGFEQALAVALGEALTAALDTQAAMHWRELPALANAPSLPSGITPLAQHIQAPAALARSLSQIGLAEDAATGEHAAQHLHAGQIIVSRDGWAWRWDGFTVTPQAKTTSAVRLQQRNRLAALLTALTEAEAERQNAEAALAQTAAVFAEHQAADRQARDALKAAFAALNDARTAYAKQEKESTALTSRLAALDDHLRQIAADLEPLHDRLAAAESERKALPDTDSQRALIADKRARLAEQRNIQAQHQAEYDRLFRETKQAEQRRVTVAQDIEAWQARLGSAAEQMDALASRIHDLEIQIEALRTRPSELDAQHDALLTQLTEAEASRKIAADQVIATEHRLALIEQELKRNESALSDAREERVRAESNVTAAIESFNALRERMTEKLNCGPEDLLGIAALEEGAEVNGAALEQTLARYTRERDTMGPVNLRAETEADTLQNDIDKLQNEKEDLTAAIAKLRQGISQLNREARERLQNAFGQVNDRFQTLFKRLFNGGQAHLELIDNDDPLNAGLEIFASPPGKKTQILSLLSGGERTLTALALLFAVFQTNPSPICVLDEAEAALDESNIGRFCNLVEDIARETGTRFLIITHQRLTMAKMDRLYGVTMSEKGVSQLVSVDLAAAVALRDGEPIPATESAQAALKDVQAA